MAAESGDHTVDAAALKGLAHPLRMRLLDALNDRGSATASQLAADLGESSGSTSYHLRQLHRHGFIEDDPTPRSGRQRYWRQRVGGWDLPVFDLADDPANVAAVDLVLRAELQADQRRAVEMLAAARHWPEQWRQAANRRDAHVELSAEQTRAMHTELGEVVERYRAMPPGPGARRVSVVIAVSPTDHQVTP